MREPPPDQETNPLVAAMHAPAAPAWSLPAGLVLPRGASLFYPCCGRDVRLPLALFQAHVDVFWFVDLEQLPGPERGVTDAMRCDWLLPPGGYRRREVQVTGTLSSVLGTRPDPATGRVRRWLEPCLRTERYERPDGSMLTLHRKRGFGPPTLEQVGELAVFFYRGDSMGEGGSGIRWFAWYGPAILARLTRPGLVVTDGSNTWHHRRSKPWQQLVLPPEAAAGQVPPAFTLHRRQFTCLGDVGLRHGPTFAWRVE